MRHQRPDVVMRVAKDVVLLVPILVALEMFSLCCLSER